MHRRFFNHGRNAVLPAALLCALWASTPEGSLQASDAARGQTRAEVPALWPGVSFRLARVERLDERRILIRIRISNHAPPGGQRVALEGEGPDEVAYWTHENGRREEIARVRPAYTMARIAVWEEAQRVRLKPLPRTQGDPYPGRDRVRKPLAPGEAVELGGIYELVPESRTLRIILPQARGTIANIPVPELKPAPGLPTP